MTEPRLGAPDLGVGAGLRIPYYRHIFDQEPKVDFFEIISENYMVDGGTPIDNLERILDRYPLVQHGVSMGIGNPDPPSKEYLVRLKRLHDNHGFDPYEYVSNVPHDRIVQIHIAGHNNKGDYIIDVHNGDIIDPVWDLYRYTIELAGPVSTIIEWDTGIPDFPVVAAVMEKIKTVRNEALQARAARVAAGKDPRPQNKRGGIPQIVPPDRFRNPHRMTQNGGARELPQSV